MKNHERMMLVRMSDTKKYNIKKKEEPVEVVQEEPNPLMRKKKTPEELAAEAEQEDLDDFTIPLFVTYCHLLSNFRTIHAQFACIRAEDNGGSTTSLFSSNRPSTSSTSPS
ncbi:hypothetical protein DMENIID0001_043770 [Sergentomyia squamirostris]